MIVSLLKKYWITCLSVLLAAGCSKSSPQTGSEKSPVVEAKPDRIDRIVFVHWAGTQRVSADANSAELKTLASTPESVKLREQTLDKLCRAPWALRNVSVETNAAKLLRPLVEDVLAEDSELEMVRVGDTPAFTVAVRLDPNRSRSWESNLATVVEALSGKKPETATTNSSRWISPLPLSSSMDGPTNEIRNGGYLAFDRVNDWTVLAFARKAITLEPLLQRFRDQQSKDLPLTNSWIEAAVEFSAMAQEFPILTSLYSPAPSARLAVKGDGGKVRAEMTLTFPKPLELKLDAWNVPTNLIGQPLASFTATRGLSGLLTRSGAWSSLKFPSAPNQLYVWGAAGDSRFTFFAAPTGDANAIMDRATQLILPEGKNWMNKEGIAGFKRATNYHGVEWQGMPFLWPFLKAETTNNESYLMGGMFPHVPPLTPLPASYYSAPLEASNLVYYGWEQTSQRIEHWLYIGQFVRFVSGEAQLPFDGAGTAWLKLLKSKPSEATTRIQLVGANELRLERTSSLGLTAIELHLLTDWLESPDFPLGIHTLTAKPEKLPQ